MKSEWNTNSSSFQGFYSLRAHARKQTSFMITREPPLVFGILMAGDIPPISFYQLIWWYIYLISFCNVPGKTFSWRPTDSSSCSCTSMKSVGEPLIQLHGLSNHLPEFSPRQTKLPIMHELIVLRLKTYLHEITHTLFMYRPIKPKRYIFFNSEASIIQEKEDPG